MGSWIMDSRIPDGHADNVATVGRGFMADYKEELWGWLYGDGYWLWLYG